MSGSCASRQDREFALSTSQISRREQEIENNFSWLRIFVIENSATPDLTLPVVFGIVKHLHNIHTASRKEHVCCL